MTKTIKPMDSMTRVALDKQTITAQPFETGLIDLIGVKNSDVIRARVDGQEVMFKKGMEPKKGEVYAVLSAETSKTIGVYDNEKGLVRVEDRSHTGQYDKMAKQLGIPGWMLEDQMYGRR